MIKPNDNIPGSDFAAQAEQSLRDASQIPASHDETNPAGDRTIAEAQVQAALAVWSALADIAQELTLIRKMQD